VLQGNEPLLGRPTLCKRDPEWDDILLLFYSFLIKRAQIPVVLLIVCREIIFKI
jgi:hypothetical protein